MATIETENARRAGHGAGAGPGESQAGMGELVRQLAQDAARLMRQEIQLARMEIAESITTAIGSSVMIAVAGAIAAVGGLFLAVALCLGIGVLLGGAYWAGALITGLLLLAGGGLVARRAAGRISEVGLKPEATVETLREDARWARDQARQLTRGVRD